MKWSELKKDIKSLTPEEKAELELMAAIARIRKQKNITQEQLAQKANVTQTQVARVENLTYAPSLDTLTKILYSLDLELGLVDRKTGNLINV